MTMNTESGTYFDPKIEEWIGEENEEDKYYQPDPFSDEFWPFNQGLFADVEDEDELYNKIQENIYVDPIQFPGVTLADL